MEELHLDPHAINDRGLEVVDDAMFAELDDEEREGVHEVPDTQR